MRAWARKHWAFLASACSAGVLGVLAALFIESKGHVFLLLSVASCWVWFSIVEERNVGMKK